MRSPTGSPPSFHKIMPAMDQYEATKLKLETGAEWDWLRILEWPYEKITKLLILIPLYKP